MLAFDLVAPGATVRVVANFGEAAAGLPADECLLASAPLEDGRLPPDAAAWILRPG